jgi:hypothetical protein
MSHFLTEERYLKYERFNPTKISHLIETDAFIYKNFDDFASKYRKTIKMALFGIFSI